MGQCRRFRSFRCRRAASLSAAATVFSFFIVGCGGPNGIEQRVRAQSAAGETVGGAAGDIAANPYPQRIPAPPLEAAAWVNTATPHTLAEFRGRFVLLDFWTFCCINCMHVLPELKKLEHAYPNELVVIGIHSPKFQSEHDTENIREAVLRYELEHPVVNDSTTAIWNAYGAQSWPTLVLIDPAGDVVWAASGERTFEDIKAVIDRGLPFYRTHVILKPGKRVEIVDASKLPATPLRFPGKILADEAGGRLFIADSNHNRIVVAKFDGKLETIIGKGTIGRDDGSFESSSFNHPQGMALVGNILYVADTENHLIRKADLTANRVATVAGTGNQGNAALEILHPRVGVTAAAKPMRTPISSPWAVWAKDADLYIAMAGMHQIWKMRLDESAVTPFAGNGREDIQDGPLLPNMPFDPGFASFAQPSGLSSDGNQLFVADSEGSTVRVVPFDQNGKVETLVGLTGTLFDFGDVDGEGRNVRLQHPLDVAWSDGNLYVADTYNNKVKAIDVARRSCRTIAGSGKSGSSDAENGAGAAFSEPAGISVAGGKLYVADTNNHAIRVVALKPPYRVTTLKIDGLSAPRAK